MLPLNLFYFLVLLCCFKQRSVSGRCKYIHHNLQGIFARILPRRSGASVEAQRRERAGLSEAPLLGPQDEFRSEKQPRVWPKQHVCLQNGVGEGGLTLRGRKEIPAGAIAGVNA